MVLLESKRKLATGDQMPYFILRGVDGRDHAVKDYAGKPTLVVFMCNHCPYVHAKLPSVIRLSEKYAGRVNFVGINSNDPEYEGEGFEKMKEFARSAGMKFDYLIDDSQKVAREYGAVCTPDPFLFDAGGKLAYHGRLDESPGMETSTKGDVAEAAIESLLAGESPEKDFLPSHGCSIKWKHA